ncbi:MAG: hypothetical protein ACSHXI_07015 [Hoeflea sp.]|uniref:hypothetical protein n=1 Tax=Hoeflea sp. TaxID=1940281 RepID=UPI003EF810E5
MKTHQFRIKVTTGKKSYLPGEDVPVGGKDGITAGEIASIEEIHGKWAGGAATPAASADAAALKASEVARQAAEDKVMALTAVIAAQSEVDAASVALSESDNDEAALKALDAAETALAETKVAAGLSDAKT